MTQKTRYFLVGAALVLVVGVGGGLLTFLLEAQQGAGEGGAIPELRLVPEDAAIVAFVDVRTVMASELRQRLLAAFGESQRQGEVQGRRAFEEGTGVDVERDIDHVVAFLTIPSAEASDGSTTLSTPEPPGVPRVPHGAVLIRGQFDRPRLEGLAEQSGARSMTYRDRRLFVGPSWSFPGAARGPGSGEEQTLVVGFLEPDLLGVGSLDAFERVIDLQADAGAAILDSPDLSRLIGDSGGNASGAPATFWAVGLFESLLEQAELPTGVQDRLPPITHFGIQGRVNGGLDARIRMEARDEASAQQVQDVVRGFVALAKMHGGGLPQLDQILQSLQLETPDPAAFVMSFFVPADLFVSLGGLSAPSGAPEPSEPAASPEPDER